MKSRAAAVEPKFVSFNVSREDSRIITAIAQRAVAIAQSEKIDWPFMDCEMDITACHANGNPLKLRELAGADDFNFIHDVFGIRRHIDRETGQLGDHFSPRYSA